MFDQHERISPQGLEAEIAAPGAADQSGGEEEQGGGNEKQQGKQENVLRVNDEVEDEEAPGYHVKHDGLLCAAGTLPR